MAEPTAAQRRMFAKMGLAMPDGSFYIRNGSVGASDLENAIGAVGRGEADGGNGNDIRRFIMKRAKALNLSGKIPDTWNPDGSLKHDWTSEVENYLSHFGVKGMQWRSTAERQAALNTQTGQGQKDVQKAKATAAKKQTPHQKHLLHLAHLLALSRAVHAAHTAHVAHLKATGQHAKIPAAVAAHAQKQAAIAKLATQPKPTGAAHSGLDEVGTFLEHFGVKGQKWGVRRNSRNSGVSAPAGSSADHQQAVMIKAKIKAHGGVHALSNDELKAVSERMNLEANYARLNPQTGNLEKGRSFVKTVTGDAKTILDAVDTGRRVIKLAQGAQPSGSSHQSRRTRNAALRVVSVR